MVIKLDELNVDLKDIDWGELDQAAKEKPAPSAIDTYAVQPGDHAPASATAKGETALSDSDLADANLRQATSLEKEAKRLRQKIIDGKKVEQTVVHGAYIDDRDTTYIDDRDTIIKDSVVNRSNIGGGSKAEGLREAKSLFEEGLIDESEYKQMKKEILGK